jgi:DNA modification methylase
MKFELHHGDCLDVLKTLADCSVDAIVTDPPYGLGKEPDPVKVMAAWILQGYFEVDGSGFMGKKWDAFVPQPIIWKEAFRVLKPGGHLLAFAGTRTQDWMAMSLRFAGFEIRDMIAWVYGSGFPKSLDVSKAIDKGSGENRDRQLKFTAWMRSTGITADQINEATQSSMASHYLTDKSQPAIATADLFDKLRPFLPDVPEEIERLVCERTGIEWTAYRQREVVGKGSSAISTRKDLRVDNGTVWGAKSSEFNLTAPATEAAKQWEGWGTALKPALEPITLARKPLIGTVAANVLEHGTGGLNIDGCRIEAEEKLSRKACPYSDGLHEGWDRPWRHDPAAVEAQRKRNEEAGAKADALGRFPANFIHDGSEEVLALFPDSDGSGSARTLNRGQRDDGWGMADEPGLLRDAGSGSAARFFYCAKASRDDRDEGLPTDQHSSHPTVKPTDLMRYLCRLITPPGGIILDPFTGSGSTGKAAMAEGFRFIGIEREAEYIEIARARISAEADKPRQLSLF